MMLYPPMGDLMDKVGSRYMLVNAVARRAREIADEAEHSFHSLLHRYTCFQASYGY